MNDSAVWHSIGRASLLMVALWLTGGCQPAGQELLYVPRKELAELATKGLPGLPASEMSDRDRNWVREEVEVVRETLQDYFGTPLLPRRKILVPQSGSAAVELRNLGSLNEPASDGSQRDAFAAQLREERGQLARLQRGAAVFQQYCYQCHGVTGDGAGPAASGLKPPPRDYRQGIFKFTSTERGAAPLREDLARIIQTGAKGTSMPSFRLMDHDDLNAVVDYVIHLSQRGQLERKQFEMISEVLTEGLPADDSEFATWKKETWEPYRAEGLRTAFLEIEQAWREAPQKIVMPLTVEPATTPESIKEGRIAFLTHGCSKCHGDDGRGRTQDNVGKDAWGHTTNAADLTSGMLHGGRRSIDLYRRIYAGINGTPMPSFAEALKDKPEQIWRLVHYIQAISRRDPIVATLPKSLPPTPASAGLSAPAESQ